MDHTSNEKKGTKGRAVPWVVGTDTVYEIAAGDRMI